MLKPHNFDYTLFLKPIFEYFTFLIEIFYKKLEKCVPPILEKFIKMYIKRNTHRNTPECSKKTGQQQIKFPIKFLSDFPAKTL